MYYQDIFYKFDKEQFADIVKWAVENAYLTRVDIMDGWTRKATEYTPEYYMEQRETSRFIHDVVIYRRGYDYWKAPEHFSTNWCIEIGSCTDNLYLFVYVDENKLDELINKFNLKE
jgi:hypothetical protein